MEKQKLEFDNPVETVEIGEVGGHKIFVRNFISYKDQLLLISRYLENYFLSEESDTQAFISRYNLLGAEQALIFEVIDKYTNIMLFDEDENLVVDWDALVSSGLVDVIKDNIKNFYDLTSTIYIMVENVKTELHLRNSFMTVLQRATEILLKFVQNISDVEMTEEGMKNLAKQISNLGEVLEDSPIASLIEDSKR